MKIFTDKQYYAERDRIRFEYDEEKRIHWRIDELEQKIYELRCAVEKLKVQSESHGEVCEAIRNAGAVCVNGGKNNE